MTWWLVDSGIWTIADARLFELNGGMHESIMECCRNIFLIDALKRIDRLFDYGQMLDRSTRRGWGRGHRAAPDTEAAGARRDA
jgi:DNA-binding GntR family transcriptional regulator